ncbi:zinc-dependent alcohol dehydrogenase family protein [Criblamydia sequanensis]|uniref:Alcohol dehydrogenase n=1 Tax=Candidatus Criblamydia sequanensis CRIB-18 TaxID=1437425 RepID=A0A090E2F7_9BACT|nr:zinc-dependent alcohol dehydrogenase family protein [Criblamydia sequanensis]CDR34834.1 Alcohol dehydrogenase [Criblamydia sequanensis CRIB-18]
MRAMVLEEVGQPLLLKDLPCPIPKPYEVLIKVKACGVCRTDLHIVDGELPHPKLPLIPGHQVVGIIDKLGENVSKHKIGERVGIPWLGGSCHLCEFCLSDRENLCDKAIYTGYLQDGGFADYCTAHEDFVLALPHVYDDLHTAPLLCAGLIGYRAFRLAGPVKTIGFYGFGSAAHLLIQVANALNRDVYVFTRPGDEKTQAFARSLGAKWTGGSDQLPPIALDAALIFAPVGALYPEALKAIKKGGKVISAGIHMSDIPSFPYALLWGERSMSSVANLTRLDGTDFMHLIDRLELKITVTPFALENANQALIAIKTGTLEGSAVLEI